MTDRGEAVTGDYYATAAYGEANRWLYAEVERLTAERDEAWRLQRRMAEAHNEWCGYKFELQRAEAEVEQLRLGRAGLIEREDWWEARATEQQARAEAAEAELRALRSWADGARVDIEGLAAEKQRLEGLLGDNFLNNRVGWARMAQEAEARIAAALAICERVGIGFPSRALAESITAALSGSPAVDGDTA